jgi:hypothetical protein
MKPIFSIHTITTVGETLMIGVKKRHRSKSTASWGKRFGK